jgi:small neutral amino acid transporter SnatA (MarC family)
MDPMGNIPFFLTALRHVEPPRQGRVIGRELLVAYAVMVGFLFAGGPLLAALQISEPALTIAGGVILFLIALRMVFPPPGRSLHEEVEGEPFIVPLAVPYVAGPSVLATELLLMSREPDRWGSWWVALTLAWVATAVILILASRLRSYLSPRAMTAMERLMGMVLVAIAIQMFLTGVGKYVAGLPGPGPPRAASACRGGFLGWVNPAGLAGTPRRTGGVVGMGHRQRKNIHLS